MGPQAHSTRIILTGNKKGQHVREEVNMLARIITAIGRKCRYSAASGILWEERALTTFNDNPM
jgi:hypothetical protein